MAMEFKKLIRRKRVLIVCWSFTNMFILFSIRLYLERLNKLLLYVCHKEKSYVGYQTGF